MVRLWISGVVGYQVTPSVRCTDKTPHVQHVPRTKRPKGQNVPRIKRPKGQNVPRTKYPTAKTSVVDPQGSGTFAWIRN